MKPKNYPTEPFKYTYRVYDKYDGVCCFTTTDVEEAFDVLREQRNNLITINKLSNEVHLYHPGHPMRSWYVTVPRFEVWDHFGERVTPPYTQYRRRYSNYYDGTGSKLDNVIIRYRKNNVNKIKQGYSHAYTYENSRKFKEYDDFIIGGCHRKFSTTHERRQNIHAIMEYGDTIVRGKRRGHNLPNTWDDLPNRSWGAASSWKHNSKRRKQWKVDKYIHNENRKHYQ